MANNNYFIIPGTSIRVYEGDIIKISNQPTVEWIVHNGWYVYSGVQNYGWYFVSTLTTEILPANVVDLTLCTLVSIRTIGSEKCDGKEVNYTRPFTDADAEDLRRTFITVDTLGQRDNLDPKLLIDGKLIRVNDNGAGIAEYFTWDSKNNIWVSTEFGGTVSSVKIETTSPIAIDDDSAITISGVRIISHEDSGVSEGNYGDESAQTPEFGDSFKVPYISVDAKGHITEANEHTVTLPDVNNLARQVHDIVVEELADNGAEETGYDNTESGLEATNVQDAIDEVNTKIENIPSVDAYTREETDDKFATKNALNDKANKDDFDNLVEGLSDYGILQVGSIRNIYDKTHNTAGSYWIVASDTNKAKHYAYTGWNYTEDYEILNGASYVYKGLTVLGSSPVATYLDSNHSPIAGAYLHAQTGENTINPPPDAKYISFSVNNADVNTFELIQTTGGSQINERVTVLERSITRCNLYETPTPEDHDLCIVNNGLGVAYSDLQQWLWVRTNGAAVCCNAYSTMKISDGKTINQVNGDVVYEAYSVTKLLSCLVAAMYIPALSDTVTVIASDIGSETGSTIVQEGDVISYEDLLYAALLKSDNNAANALRRPIGFIIDTSAQTMAQAKVAFYNKMQEVANSIGMINTDCNPVRISAAAGVHSTTNDLCKLVKYIYENNSIISGIWGQLSHQITVAGTNPRSWTVNSTTTPQARQIIPEFVGGKTGSGNIPYTYAFCWKDSDNNYYATALLDGDLRKGNRFDDSRLILNNAYFAMNS